MAKITIVQKAIKDQGTCGRCGDPLPKGSPYRHATPGFRGRKIVRCMKPECTFRQSELTTSKMAEVYAAQEDAADDIAQAETVEDLKSVAEATAERIREVAQEYADAADAMGGAGEEMQERADLLESAADEIEGFDFDEFEEAECPCGGEGDELCECGGTGTVTDLDGAKSGLSDVIEEASSV